MDLVLSLWVFPADEGKTCLPPFGDVRPCGDGCGGWMHEASVVKWEDNVELRRRAGIGR